MPSPHSWAQLVVFDEADLLLDRGNQGKDTQACIHGRVRLIPESPLLPAVSNSVLSWTGRFDMLWCFPVLLYFWAWFMLEYFWSAVAFYCATSWALYDELSSHAPPDPSSPLPDCAYRHRSAGDPGAVVLGQSCRAPWVEGMALVWEGVIHAL